MMKTTRVVLAVAAVLSASQASAGRRPFTFTFDAETLNQGDLELEQWLWAKVQPPAPLATSAWVWFGPVYGLTRNVEIALPWELVATPTQTHLADFQIDARIRLFDRAPGEDERVFHPMLRLYYQFNFNHPISAGKPLNPFIGGNAVLAVGDPAGAHATVDAGFYADRGFDVRYTTLGVAYTHPIVDETLRVGLEYFHEVSLNATLDPTRRFFVGPDVAFSRGQFWMTAGALFGITSSSPEMYPRLIVGASI